MTRMLRHAAAMIDPPPEKITWCYGEWQEAYATTDLVHVRFEEGLSTAAMFESTMRNVIIIDNRMAEKDERVTTLFTKNKLKRAIIANADADLLCALAECAYNILKKKIPLTLLQRRRLSKYRTKLRELAQRRTPVARRRRILLQPQVGEGQSGGFLSAFLAPLASSVFLPLLREVLLKRYIHGTRTQDGLGGPRLLDTLRSPPPPATDTFGKKVQALDDDMKTILDRKDLDDGTKVTLYNQVLQRYTVLADKHVKEPIRVVTVNESVTGSGSGVEPGPEGAVRVPSTGLEATVLDTVPKTMQAKARRLMEHLKRYIAWTARGELIHEGVPVVGSNVVDLVNDLLRKRKTDPPGWQPFA